MTTILYIEVQAKTLIPVFTPFKRLRLKGYIISIKNKVFD